MGRLIRLIRLLMTGLLSLGGIGVGTWSGLSAAAPQQEGDEFFERRIRPVLVEHCYACHSSSAATIESGLQLDTREGLLNGGDGGDILRGDAAGEEPRVLRALRHQDLQMPPEDKLPAAIIGDFARWIELGAPMPTSYGSTSLLGIHNNPVDFSRAREHWAYRPIIKPVLPAVGRRDWCETPVDFFILQQLEEAQLCPNPPADRRTLLRRLYVDLTGLAPTADDVEAFASNSDPDAWEQVVDRLLASPAYGERWGRHWLDVARYADTKDLVLVFGDDRLRPYSYTYRDYVIRAFNRDLPYDRFIHEQLAADRLSDGERESLAALGFLTLGRLFDNNMSDIYDDRIDTVTRGLLGLTVSCARCHDHKYDAIPTEDYYALYGIFANSETPLELPVIQTDELTSSQSEINQQIEAKLRELRDHLENQYSQLTRQARDRISDYLVRVTQKPDPLETVEFYLSLSPDDLRPQIVAQWRRHIQRRATAEDPVWGLWGQLITPASTESYAVHVRQVLDRPAASSNPLLLERLRAAQPQTREEVARIYGEALLAGCQEAANQSSNRSSNQSSAGANLTPEQLGWQQLAEELLSHDSPVYFPRRYTYLYMARVERGRYEELIQAIDRLAVQSPVAPPRAMTLVDSAEPQPTRVLLRGNPLTPGREVPRRFLQVLSGGGEQTFPAGSGRLELAHAITAPSNPLTSRVLVNRLWMQHLGSPLVSTPSDFGERSEPPSHPQLLDFLADYLQQHAWSIKHWHRLIVMSATYQQSSADRLAGRELDPQNRLFWRANPRRLELEAMRDLMLAVAGLLDGQLYGRPQAVVDRPENRRRTIYGIVDRQELPGIYRVFDFASPDQTADQRPRTITPQQALFALNSALVLNSAQAIAERLSRLSEEDRAQQLFRLVLSRPALASEVAQIEAYVAQSNDRSQAWREISQALLVSNEFLYVD